MILLYSTDTVFMTFRVYCDMTGDLWRSGHMAFCAKARAVGERELERRRHASPQQYAGQDAVTIVVGITADKHLAGYKRRPIMTNAERCSSARGTRGVDEVIANVPLITSRAFMDEHRLDLVVHGDDFTEDKVKMYYGAAMARDQYRETSYTPGISTSDLIRRVIETVGQQHTHGSSSTRARDLAIVGCAAGVVGFVAGLSWPRRG